MDIAEEDLLDVKQVYSKKCVGESSLECVFVTWKISNFSSRARKVDKELTSGEFHCSDATWLLRVYPNGSRFKKNVGNVGLYLDKTHSTTQKHVVNMKFSIPYKDGKYKCFETKQTFLTGDRGWGFEDTLSRSEVLRKKNGYLPGDVLTIHCDITVSPEIDSPGVSSIDTSKFLTGENFIQKKDSITNTSSEETDALPLHDESPTGEDNLNALSKDFETLYNNPRFADVTLKLGEHEFSAHKLVLRSRSKVFDAMFEHDMKENRQDTVDLVAMEIDTVKDMLRYVYCGKVRQLPPSDALNLYVAADRYDLQELILYCRKIILNKLSIDNICEVCTVVDLHHDPVLMDAVKNFLSENLKDVLKSEKWKTFAKQNISLVLNLIQSAILHD